jgi:hypothetical protein
VRGAVGLFSDQHGGDVDKRCCQARGQRAQQRFRGIGSRVGAEEHGRFPGIQDELTRPSPVLLASTVERLDGAPVVSAAEPDIGRSELKSPKLRVRFDGVERGEKDTRINTITDGFGRIGHDFSKIS